MKIGHAKTTDDGYGSQPPVTVLASRANYLKQAHEASTAPGSR